MCMNARICRRAPAIQAQEMISMVEVQMSDCPAAAADGITGESDVPRMCNESGGRERAGDGV